MHPFKPIAPLVTLSVLLLLCAVALCPWLARAEGQPASYSQALATPAYDGPVRVRVAFQLHDVDSIDDESERFEFTGTLVLEWRDPRQAFNPEIEKVSEKVFVGDFQVNELSPAWYPQVVLANEAGEFEKHGSMLRVKPDGTTTLIETVNAIAGTKLDMHRYPFDSQQLEAVFLIHGQDSSEAVFEPFDGGDPSDVTISQWDVDKVSSSVRSVTSGYHGHNQPSSAFVLRVDVSRQSLFAIRLIVVPLIVIVMLSWAVFWMDRSSLGDRINVSFIGILTAVAYQNVIGDIMPHISYVTLMNGFVNVSFLIMVASVMINLVVGYCDRRGWESRGNRIDYRCRWIFPSVYFLSLTLLMISTFCFF